MNWFASNWYNSNWNSSNWSQPGELSENDMQATLAGSSSVSATLTAAEITNLPDRRDGAEGGGKKKRKPDILPAPKLALPTRSRREEITDEQLDGLWGRTLAKKRGWVFSESATWNEREDELLLFGEELGLNYAEACE